MNGPTVELHTKGRDQHILVDDEGMKDLRRLAPPVKPGFMDLQQQLCGIPIYVGSCPCDEATT